MTSQPYMPLWVGDFLGDTLHLEAEEVGQYLLILMAMWRAGGELPDDAALLSRVTRGPMSENVRALLTVRDGKLTQMRLLRELSNARSVTDARREAGKRGANAKWLKNKDTKMAKPSVCHKQNNGTQDHTQLATNVANYPLTPKGGNRATSLSPDWKPNEDCIQYGITLGFTRDAVDGIAEDFRIWALSASGKNTLKKNWELAFKGWMRRETKGTYRGSGPPKKGNFAQITDELLAEAREKDARNSSPRLIESGSASPGSR